MAAPERVAWGGPRRPPGNFLAARDRNVAPGIRGRRGIRILRPGHPVIRGRGVRRPLGQLGELLGEAAAGSFPQLRSGLVLHHRNHAGSRVLEARLHRTRGAGALVARRRRLRKLLLGAALLDQLPGAHPVFMVATIRLALGFPDGVSDASNLVIGGRIGRNAHFILLHARVSLQRKPGCRVLPGRKKLRSCPRTTRSDSRSLPPGVAVPHPASAREEGNGTPAGAGRKAPPARLDDAYLKGHRPHAVPDPSAPVAAGLCA